MFNQLIMSISTRCKAQQAIADRIFMDFKYTKAGSREQHHSLKILNGLVAQWACFLATEEARRKEMQVVAA